MIKNSIFIFLLALSTPALAARNGSLGFDGGFGGWSSSGWPLTDYGVSLAVKGDRPGELAFDYNINQVAATGGNVTLQQIEFDLRHRFSERFGFYLGLPINYFSSSNESLIPSGVNIGFQLGYDWGLLDSFSIGLHGQETLVRNYYVGLLTFKFWAPR